MEDIGVIITMRKIVIYSLMAAAVLASGCRGGKDATRSEAKGKYVRPAIVERTEAELKTDGLMIEAKMAQEVGKAEEALAKYREIVTRDPHYGGAYYEMGAIMAETGYLDSAVYYTRKAEETDGRNEWYKIQLSALYGELGRYKDQVAVMESLVRVKEDKLDYYYELSNAYLAAGDLEGAIEVLNRVEKKIGVTEMVSVQKQKLWSALGAEEKAAKEIVALSDAMPQEKKYSAILAELYMKQKKYGEAKKYYDRILAADPKDEYIHISLASYYRQTGNMEKAYEELKRGFAHESMGCKAKVQIVLSMYTIEELYARPAGRAFELFEEVVRQCGSDVTGYAPVYGDILMRQGRMDEAEAQFRAYIAEDSSRYEVWEALLYCESSDEKKAEQAMRDAQRAKGLFPLHTLPYYVEGLYYFEHKEYEKAEEAFVMCVKTGCSNGRLEPDVYALLGGIYYEEKRYEESWECYERCIKLNDDDIYSKNNYAYYLSERGEKLERAEQISRTTIAKEPENATFLDTYAWILHKMGRNAEALKYMEKALKFDKDNSATLKEHYWIIKAEVR